MKVAVDTNILVYALALNDAARAETAQRLLARLEQQDFIIPAQVMGELMFVLLRRLHQAPATIADIVQNYRTVATIMSTQDTTLDGALAAFSAHSLSFWDAVVLATAAEAGCELLLSEDMQDGFVWRGVTVANPFAATPHPLLTAL